MLLVLLSVITKFYCIRISQYLASSIWRPHFWIANTLEVTVWIGSSSKFVRMLVLMISGTGLNKGHQGQILGHQVKPGQFVELNDFLCYGCNLKKYKCIKHYMERHEFSFSSKRVRGIN